MTFHKKETRRRRRSDITAYKTFSDSFILTPHDNIYKDDINLLNLSSKYSRAFPVLKVSNSFVPMLGAKDIPNLKGIPNIRRKPRSRITLSPEDTFDVDFSMPREIRQVLEEEGLDKKVINGVIGRSEKKHKMMSKMVKVDRISRSIEELAPKSKAVLPPIISTQNKVPKYNGTEPSSWLDLSRQYPRNPPSIALWENPVTKIDKEEFGARTLSRDVHDEIQNTTAEVDSRERQSVEDDEIHPDQDSSPPRIVLISSNVPKNHLLTQVYQDNVIPIPYDFDSYTVTELLDEIWKKLNAHRRNCKATSIMVLCQGGPGYIYLLKNCVITPQKLHKPSYRSVVGFWRALAGMINQLNTGESAIHFVGFNLAENHQGKTLLAMLQNLIYPNLVNIDFVKENTEIGRKILEKYFIYRRYRIWKTYQKSSFNDIDMSQEKPGPVKRHFRVPVMRVAR